MHPSEIGMKLKSQNIKYQDRLTKRLQTGENQRYFGVVSSHGRAFWPDLSVMITEQYKTAEVQAILSTLLVSTGFVLSLSGAPVDLVPTSAACAGSKSKVNSESIVSSHGISITNAGSSNNTDDVSFPQSQHNAQTLMLNRSGPDTKVSFSCIP